MQSSGRFPRLFRRLDRKGSLVNLIRRAMKLLYIILFFSLSAGVINTILEGSRPELSTAVVSPSRGIQTWSEMTINFIVIALGTLGIFIAYSGARQTVRGRLASAYVLIGVFIIALALLVGFQFVAIKRFA